MMTIRRAIARILRRPCPVCAEKGTCFCQREHRLAELERDMDALAGVAGTRRTYNSLFAEWSFLLEQHHGC